MPVFFDRCCGLWTVQVGITLSGGGAVGGSVSVEIAFGYSAGSGFTAGFYEGVGIGAEIGAVGSASGTLAISGAAAANALTGTAAQDCSIFYWKYLCCIQYRNRSRNTC